MSRSHPIEPLEPRRHLTSTVSGTAFNDANGDGYRAYNDGPLVNYPIRGDTNRNGTIDSSDKVVYTDASGAFSFTGIADGGDFAVVPVDRSGYVNTGTSSLTFGLPARDYTANAPDIFSFTTKSLIVGNVLEHPAAADDGKLDSIEQGLAGQVVYIDSNQNDKRDTGEPFAITDTLGGYKLGVDVPTKNGATTTASFHVRLDAGVDLKVQTGAATVSVTSHARAVAPTFFVTAPAGSQLQISGPTATLVSADATVTSVASGGTLGLTAYANDSTSGDTFQWDAHYAPGQVFNAEATGKSFDFVDNASQNNAAVVLVATRVHTAAGYGPVRVIRVDIRPVVKTASISGYAFNDTNKDGQFEPVETKTSGKVVFLDTNNNGNLDAGEPSVITPADGTFRFTGLAAGTYHLRRVFPDGFVSSTPLYDITLTTGQAATGYAIGSKNTTYVPPPPKGTASLAGVLFFDNNANGKFDAGDGAMANVHAFLDGNGNNVLDDGELVATTDAAGKFLFQNLAAGTYHVRRIYAAAQTASTPRVDVTVKSGQAKTGLLIGTKRA